MEDQWKASHLGMSSHGARGAPAQEEGSDIGTKLRYDIGERVESQSREPEPPAPGLSCAANVLWTAASLPPHQSTSTLERLVGKGLGTEIGGRMGKAAFKHTYEFK